jgi:macrolide-specific efflux system membrane fusion protein
MSSTERAALLDSAKSKGQEEKSYWEDIYKPIPLIAPIDGTVIVSVMQPGQTVAQSDAVVVLSDRLIVQAQVDETDVGRVRQGQRARISLDAYPGIEVGAAVGHIYHESQIVNNVTIYKVDVVPDEVPAVFRSGMSANVRIVEEDRPEARLVPAEAVKKEKGGQSYVMVRSREGQKPAKRPVETGISDGVNVEIVSGLEAGEVVVVTGQRYVPSKASGTNPFMPQRRRPASGNSSSTGR